MDSRQGRQLESSDGSKDYVGGDRGDPSGTALQGCKVRESFRRETSEIPFLVQN